MKETNGGLARQPIRVIARHRDQVIAETIFQHTPVRIGRLVDNDIVLPYDFVSRYHCELRFDNGQWIAVDLGSKNGLLVDGQARTNEVELQDGGEFRVQEVTISIAHATADEVPQDFTAIRESDTFVGHSRGPASQERAPLGGKRPLLNIDAQQLFCTPHESAPVTRDKALQLMIFWHDQLLDAREFAVGENIYFEFIGTLYEYGTVKPDKTIIRVPKGATAIGLDPSLKKLTLTWTDPVAYRLDNDVMFSFRYVPKSKELTKATEWVEQKLVDPLFASGAVHGAAAVTALFMAPKKHGPVIRDEPERFATIIVQPTPPPIALQPTPAPTPTPLPVPTPPLPEPTPEPPKIAKKEPPKPTPPKEKLKTVVTEKKMKKPALKKKEDPGVEHKEKPVVKKVLPKPEPKEPPPVVVAKAEEPPAPAVEKPEPPAPTPQPFNAKSVGTLKMLSNLSLGPASNVANVEKIQISRAPANVSGSMIGREAVSGTGEMISKLSQSANGGGTGKGDGVSGVAVGGKAAGGQYKMAGLAGKAGTRKIRGSVLGGATYSELSKNEGLTREQVMKVVQKHQAQIQQCYERSLMTNPDLVGRAEFEWEITPKGSVTFVKVKEATLKNGETLLECVKGVFAGMKFPEAKNGESTTPTIGLPFGRL